MPSTDRSAATVAANSHSLPGLGRIYDDNGVAALLQVSKRTVHRFVKLGILPPPIKLGHLIRWHETGLAQALLSPPTQAPGLKKRGRPSRAEEAAAARAGITVAELRARLAEVERGAA